MTFALGASSAPDFEPATPHLRPASASLAIVVALHGPLRTLATRADADSTAELDLATLWSELSRGLCKVADCYFSESRCYLLTRASAGQARPVPESALRVLQAVLNETGQKVVAIDMQLSTSSVASKARQALDALGACCTPSHTHPLLILAANAERRVGQRCVARLSFVDFGDSQIRVLSIARPDQCLAARLSRAEFAVARYLFEGWCQARIARARNTSRRTVANQIAAVFSALGVSGRGQFVRHLLDQPEQGATPPAGRRAQSVG